MSLWWVVNIVLIAVIIPVVVGILLQVLTPLFQIKKYADDILEYGGKLPEHLDQLGELAKTRDLVKQAGAGLGRYVSALDNIR